MTATTTPDATRRRPAWTIRPAVVDDLGELVRLARAFYDEDGFTTGTDELCDNLATLLGAENARIALAPTGDGPAVPAELPDAPELAGFALTTIDFTLEAGRVAEIQDLYVRPEHRRRGLGSLLVADALAWAQTMSASVMEVVVAPNGLDVTHLFAYYGALGFVDEGRRILGRAI